MIKKVLLLLFITSISVTNIHSASLDQTADISGLTTATAIETAIQEAIIASGSNSTITITGATSGNIMSDVTLNIPSGIAVVWKASIRLAESRYLIVDGDGSFELAAGGTINPRINVVGTNAAMLVSGGTIGAVVLEGENSTINVSGGNISSSSYRAISATGANTKVTICGNGKVHSDIMSIYAVNAVEIKDNATVSVTGTNTAIYGGENSTITVSGGTVSSVSGNAIVNNGANSQVTVSGGTITTNSGRAISINNAGSASTITICGNAKIKKTTTTNTGGAIYTEGNVEVKDNADINVSGGKGIIAKTVTVSGGTIQAGHIAIESNQPNAMITISGGTLSCKSGDVIYANETSSQIIISGNAKVQGSFYGNAIWTNGNVEVKDNAEVISTSGTRAISAHGKNSKVTVGGGIVRASTDYAICVTGTNSKITVDGGLVFAYEPAIGVNNENNFTGVSGTGVVIAWDTKPGNTSYAKGSSTDLSMLPIGCAKWDIVSEEHGISYQNGTNKGFIAVGVTVTGESAIIPTQIDQLSVYPNPVADCITISGLQVGETLYFYNLKGTELFTLKTTSNTERIAVDHLPAGIYFVKTSNGKVLKWIKQ